VYIVVSLAAGPRLPSRDPFDSVGRQYSAVDSEMPLPQLVNILGAPLIQKPQPPQLRQQMSTILQYCLPQRTIYQLSSQTLTSSCIYPHKQMESEWQFRFLSLLSTCLSIWSGFGLGGVDTGISGLDRSCCIPLLLVPRLMFFSSWPCI